MTRLVLGDLILESLTPNVNAPLCSLTVELCMLYSWGGGGLRGKRRPTYMGLLYTFLRFFKSSQTNETLGPEGFICIYPGYIVDGSLRTGVEFNLTFGFRSSGVSRLAFNCGVWGSDFRHS